MLVCNTGWIFGLLINYLLDWVNNKLMIVCVKVVNIFEKTVVFLISGPSLIGSSSQVGTCGVVFCKQEVQRS